MDSQLTRTDRHHYDQDPLHPTLHPTPVTEGGEGEHHEKKSVLKKVKAKAKKIKDTIASKTHTGHGHNHDDEDEDEYDEDDEIVQDPEVHGAPMYESAAAKNFTASQDPSPGLGARPHFDQNPEQNVCPGTFLPMPAPPRSEFGAPANVSADQDVNIGGPKVSFGEHLGEDHNAHKRRHQDLTPTPTSTPTPYQSKPAELGIGGVHEAGVAPIMYSFDKMGIHDEPQHQNDSSIPPLSTGSGTGGGLGGHGAGAAPVIPSLDKMGMYDEPYHKKDSVSTENRDYTPSFQANVTNHGRDTHEAGATPILKSFDKMGIYDEPQHKDLATTGSHDQFSPSIPSTIPENESTPTDMNIDESPKQQSYTEKISSVPSAIANKAVNAKDVIASKIGYGGNKDSTGRDSGMPNTSPTTQQSSYTGKISSATSALAGTAVSAKNAVASKLGYGGNENPTGVQTSSDINRGDKTEDDIGRDSERPLAAAVEPMAQQSSYTDKISSATSALTGTAVSAKNALASKLGYGGSESPAGVQTDSNINKGEHVRPGERATKHDQPPAQQSSYTGKLSSATSAITGTAVSAKNAVASKLGYGGSESPAGGVGTGSDRGDDVKTGGGVTSTVTDKLAPVYGTLAGVGSAVASKLPGTGRGTEGTTETEVHVTDRSGEGVSMKGYISEKLKPGEDDRALSEVISGAFHKPTVGQVSDEENNNISGVVSDAFHKQNNDDNLRKPNKPMGKVTESDEVANRLGSSEEEKTGKVLSVESPGKGVVDKITGALTGWWGKGGEMNPSQAFNDTAPSSNEGATKEEQDVAREGVENASYGDRKLQESTS